MVGRETEAQEKFAQTQKPVTTSYYTQERREEYPSFAKRYVKPAVKSVEKSVEAERAAEEARLRKAYEAQVVALEAEARRQVEAQLTALKTEARLQFEQSVTAAKEPLYDEGAKRRVGIEAPPLRVSRTEVTAWESAERSKFEESVATWERQGITGVESQISTWRKEQLSYFDQYIAEWRKTWQPKGLAERMLDVKVPSLDLKGQIAKGMGVKPFEMTSKGVRIGDVLYSPEGAKPYKPEVKILAFPAGMVASFESFAYGVGGFLGLKTPRIPTTFTGGVVMSAITSVEQGKLTESPELHRVISEYGSEYMAGSILGDVLLSYGLGKAASKIIIEPVGKTAVGKYIGYQFKVHAPKPLLRVVYGKKGAEYIIAERSPFYEGAIESISPAGKSIASTWKIPKTAEEIALSREILKGGESTFKILTPKGYKTMTAEFVKTSEFPLKMFRGEKITPMSETLKKAIGKFGEEKGIATLLSPLETAHKLLLPEMPSLAAELQFGFTPLAATTPTVLGLGSVLGVQTISKLKSEMLAKPKIKEVARMKKREVVAPTLSEALGLESWQEAAPAQATTQAVIQAPIQAQAYKMKLKLLIPTPRRKKEEPAQRRKPVRIGKLPTKKMAGYLYPVLSEREIPSFLKVGLGKPSKAKQNLSASSFIFSKRNVRKNVSKQKVRHKKK